MSEWFQYGDLFHVRDDISREDFCWTIVIEFLFGERVHLLTWHIPDIRQVDGIHGYETDEEHVDVFSRVGEGEFEAVFPRKFDGGAEPIQNGHDAENRKDKYGRKFHGLRETEDDAGDDEIFR